MLSQVHGLLAKLYDDSGNHSVEAYHIERHQEFLQAEEELRMQ